jgi:multidrug efflux system membrane fusion protein
LFNINMKYGILILAVATILVGCGKESAPAAEVESAKKEQPVLTQVVGAVVSDSENVYSGEIRARYETTLSFRIGGKIVERLVDVGAVVKEGDVLARLDQADAGLQASAAATQFQLAEAEAKRYRELRRKGFVSQSALDAKEAAYKVAAAQTGLARNQSSYTLLHADSDGVVAAVLAEAGQIVSAGQPVLRLAQDGDREVAIAIPETQFEGLAIGALADVTLWSDKNEAVHFSGRLRELAPAADPASRTYAARIALSGRGTKAALGMTAQLRFTDVSKPNRLIVPLSAIFQQGDQAAVWVVAADNSIGLRPVQVAAYRDDGAVIVRGIAAGERIVSAGVHKLSGGEKVRAIEGEFANGSAR